MCLCGYKIISDTNLNRLLFTLAKMQKKEVLINKNNLPEGMYIIKAISRNYNNNQESVEITHKTLKF